MTEKEIIKMTEFKTKALKIKLLSDEFLYAIPKDENIIACQVELEFFHNLFRLYNNFIIRTLKQ